MLRVKLNTQLSKYIPYKSDPYAYLIDTFSVNWGFYKCYLLSPFSLIGQTLQKIRIDQTEVILVVPKWPTQPWYNNFSVNVVPGTICGDPTQRESNSTTKNRGNASLVVETNTSDRESVRKVFLSQGFDNDTVNIFMVSLRKGTFSNYSLCLSKWFKFASCNMVLPSESPVQVALASLASLVREGKSFNQI